MTWIRDKEMKLRELCGLRKYTDQEIADIIGLSVHAVHRKRIRLGLPSRIDLNELPWSEAEVAFLKENYGSKPVAGIRTSLGRSRDAVRLKCRELGLFREANRHEWTPDKIAIFKGMFDAGVRLSLIASTFKIAKSRISVKAKELGWDRAGAKTSHDPNTAKRATTKQDTQEPVPAEKFCDPVSQASATCDDGLSIWELRSRSCRWPIYGSGISTRFCGQEKWTEHEESSYCEHHYKRSRSGFNRTQAEEAA